MYLMFLQFFNAVFGTAVIGYLQKMKFLAFFLLSCGAVVKEAGALTGFRLTVERYVCFICWPFLTDLAGSLSQTHSPSALST